MWIIIIIIINIDINNSNNIYFLLLFIIIIIINEITVETSCYFRAELVSLAAVFCLVAQHSSPTKEERFFKNIVDREPLPQVYIPELNDFTAIRRVSVRKIIRLKGKNSGAVVRLREIINSAQWVSAWLSLIAAGYGWFFITHIYWKQKSHH